MMLQLLSWDRHRINSSEARVERLGRRILRLTREILADLLDGDALRERLEHLPCEDGAD